MLRNRFYYSLKPFLPFRTRLAVRRWFARRKRERMNESWPIMPGSEKAPENWPGWPDGKQFALVLTHDVEGQAGLDKCRKVMELEMRLGFRSSFTLIPRGEYTVTPELRREITSNGFEVGVHDLYHDGKLFLTENEFKRNAPEINRYLKDWGAAGFRSAFMLRNPDWLHELSIEYDLSSFDTDPFEPQPQGQGTIFPFWVPRRNHGLGYVELPYTLPQDSTLFLVLRERRPDIWLQKLDWIAKHGGMALVNVHPDYMRFDGDPASAQTYDADLYREFLEYAHSRYNVSFWQPLPKAAAHYVESFKPQPQRKPKRICMVSYSDFLSDARVARYANTLSERGDEVDVLALKRAREEPGIQQLGNVRLVRIQARPHKKQRSRAGFLAPTMRFLFSSLFWITREHRLKPYDLLHIHNVPDFLVFVALYPALKGAKVILDIHDILPEFYASKFSDGETSAAVRVLKLVERVSARFADHIIISNHLWRDKYAPRTGTSDKCTVFINNVDTAVFHPRDRTRDDGKTIVIFPGGLQWHQGLDIAIRAFQRVLARLPNAEFHVYGDGNQKENLKALSKELCLNGSVKFFEPVPVSRIAEIMANADLGIVPKRADSFGNEAYSTKIMEFMATGVPVVASHTKIDSYYFDESMLAFFQPGNSEDLARAMLEIIQNQSRRTNLIAKGLHYASRNSWQSRREDYLQLVDSLLSEGSAAATA